MYVKCFAVNVEGGGGSPPVWCKQIPGIDVVTPSTVKVRSTQRYITFSFTKRRVCTCARQRLAETRIRFSSVGRAPTSMA